MTPFSLSSVLRRLARCLVELKQRGADRLFSWLDQFTPGKSAGPQRLVCLGLEACEARDLPALLVGLPSLPILDLPPNITDTLSVSFATVSFTTVSFTTGLSSASDAGDPFAFISMPAIPSAEAQLAPEAPSQPIDAGSPALAESVLAAPAGEGASLQALQTLVAHLPTGDPLANLATELAALQTEADSAGATVADAGA